MDGYTLFNTAGITAALLSLGAAFWILRLNPDKISATDALCRNRIAGIILAVPVLLWCIPHAEPIAFDWMKPHLPWMAIGCAAAGFFYLDYLFARAFGGFLILASYYFVHGAFEYHSCWMAYISILCWIPGIAGICFSGKPCWMRDTLRKCCNSPAVRRTVAGYSALLGASLLAALIAGKVCA